MCTQMIQAQFGCSYLNNNWYIVILVNIMYQSILVNTLILCHAVHKNYIVIIMMK